MKTAVLIVLAACLFAGCTTMSDMDTLANMGYVCDADNPGECSPGPKPSIGDKANAAMSIASDGAFWFSIGQFLLGW